MVFVWLQGVQCSMQSISVAWTVCPHWTSIPACSCSAYTSFVNKNSAQAFVVVVFCLLSFFFFLLPRWPTLCSFDRVLAVVGFNCWNCRYSCSGKTQGRFYCSVRRASTGLPEIPASGDFTGYSSFGNPVLSNTHVHSLQYLTILKI